MIPLLPIPIQNHYSIEGSRKDPSLQSGQALGNDRLKGGRNKRNPQDSRINPKVPRTAAFLGPIFVGRHSPQKSDPIGPFLWFFLLGPAKERTMNCKEEMQKEASTIAGRKEKGGYDSSPPNPDPKSLCNRGIGKGRRGMTASRAEKHKRNP
jgi:hypothetical protein